MRVVFLGLSITSSWGNGHATTYRALVHALAERGHDVLFLERDVPWYAENRDLPHPPYGRTALYASLPDLADRFGAAVRDADLAVLGSYVPQGVEVGRWLLGIAQGRTAFYDIDTPITVAKLERGDTEYLAPELIPCFDLYLSFTGGPMLERLEKEWGAARARVLYCSVDPSVYFPEAGPARWDLGYLGTYSEDRQHILDCLLVESARRWPGGRFVVAGPLYPQELRWPAGVERIQHVAPGEHRAFYSAQRFTLNITRADMRAAGYSPSVRLFEAAACGVPIISDYWQGLESLFEIGQELLVAGCPEEVLACLRDLPEAERLALGARARARILAEHTAAQRARELEQYVADRA